MASPSLKTFGFGLRALKKYPELVPLVSIISTACFGCCSFMAYSLATKPDVRVIKSKGPAFEDVGPLEMRKLLNLNTAKYQIFPEVEALRKEIGSYKS
ncbi:normal mucosa of esophagus-specific gene 1 protein [Elysia marginata]|uniref:Normal mucosa of esophagus-specific gene 1 protein n=1 Tax=Elysia marginata TaxID=1093978 RepID=A0AAV4FGZ9_9GAST|nr:normal mucosa of esophagus-specific gene 1 protein [Elysia marginata]